MRPECHPTENIVRALRTADWHKEEGRFSSSVFLGANTSVSRLSILPLDCLFPIFHRDLDRPPESKVIAAGEINVQTLQDIGRNHNEPKDITVEIDATSKNPAHAEIPQKLTRALAKKITKALTIHNEPS